VSATKRINLALQGGGSHGAYTWGALDAILEDERLEITGVSGTSAGAMNAVVMASGLLKDRAEARDKLERFWRAVAEATAPGSTLPGVGAWLSLMRNVVAPPSLEATVADASSPYAFNPLNLNPLGDILTRIVDFEALRAGSTPKLIIAATNVRTGKGAVFRRDKLTAKHVMASATLPHLFQTVEIDGRYYWDGGYSGNPPLAPLFNDSESGDTIIVQINPIHRHEIPRTPQEISSRVSEISFNASLLAELKYLHQIGKLIENGGSGDHGHIDRLHRIGGDGRLERFSPDTKFDASWGFLWELRELGRASAKDWLAAHFDAIGVRSTLSVSATLHKTEEG
jgi:NTE family protein